MWEQFLIKQAHPLYGWLRLFLGLCLPSAIYTHSILWLFLFIGLSIFLVFVSRPFEDHQKLDFFYHAIRGSYLEFKGHEIFLNPVLLILLGSTPMKILFSMLYTGVFVGGVYFLWTGDLIMGSILYYGCLSLKMYILSEYANISKNVLESSEWDALFVAATEIEDE